LVVDLLLADCGAVAGVMLPGEAAFHEDADLAAADCADGLGFSGGAGILVVGLGHVHGVVKGACVEDAQEDERRAQLLEGGRAAA